MNEPDLRHLFSAVLADPAPDRIDVDSAVRSGRRRRAWRFAGTAAATVPVVAVTGLLALQLTGGPADPVEVATSGAVSVTCSPEGISVSSRQVVAGPAGITLTVSGTAPAGTYLAWTFADGGGGDPLPAVASTWPLAAPPGSLRLTCTPETGASDAAEDPGRSADLTVTDPNGYWRGTSLAGRGCVPAGYPGGYLEPTGDAATAREAVDSLIRAMRHQLPEGVTAAATGTGYIGATTQRWLVSAADRPILVAAVTATGSSYRAEPTLWCAR